jgi:OOP family OmpA-OmpF porin
MGGQHLGKKSMKKYVMGVVAAAAALLSTGAMAQGYISFAGGQSNADVDCTGTLSCDNNDTALKVVGGYKFENGFALELGYVDFGKAQARVYLAPYTVDVAFESQAFTFGGSFPMNFTPEFAANFRIGVASVKTEGTVSVPTYGIYKESDSAAAPYFGLGLSYAFTTNVAGEVGVDFTKAEITGEKYDLRTVTAGVRFTF